MVSLEKATIWCLDVPKIHRRRPKPEMPSVRPRSEPMPISSLTPFTLSTAPSCLSQYCKVDSIYQKQGWALAQAPTLHTEYELEFSVVPTYFSEKLKAWILVWSGSWMWNYTNAVHLGDLRNCSSERVPMTFTKVRSYNRLLPHLVLYFNFKAIHKIGS